MSWLRSGNCSESEVLSSEQLPKTMVLKDFKFYSRVAKPIIVQNINLSILYIYTYLSYKSKMLIKYFLIAL